MNCPVCGRANRQGAAFCDGCGSSLALTCSRCNADLRPDARFCDSCGHQVGGPDVRSLTPEHLVEKILKERSTIEGERRTVTVLFADAKGFTPFSERRDPEQVYTFMQGCVQRMLEGVHRHEGTVAQFTGDGIIALFGAPIAHEDSARRAVAAALDIQRELREFIGDADADTSFRIGLNTGLVVVGSVSDDLSMDYTAIGDTANLAARMEQMAEPGTVNMTETTYQQIADYFECEDLGMHAVKGKSSEVHVYRALRERGVRTRMDASIARGLSPFTGRQREIDVLHGLWREAVAGRGQIVLISGEPGIGKSRLLMEFRRSLGDDVLWREAHCISYGEGIPYLPVIELVKNGFFITDADDAGTMIRRIDEDTSHWSPEAQKTVPYLKFLLQVDPGDAAVESMEPMERRAGILDALRALITERGRVAPRVVVVEDLHWADEQSEEAFRVCADVVAVSPVLMILTFRPGYLHPSSDLPNSHRIALANLDASSRTDLAAASLAAASLPADLAAQVTEKAEGNPLFIEEVTKALAAGVADVTTVPNSLQDVILARIDRLERTARDALQLASVIGREFTMRLLSRITDVASELDGVLTELKSLELIYEKSFFPELAYMFKHALTHDVAYSTLLVERRKLLHGIVAGAIEELYADRLHEHYETLAHHFFMAEAWEQALDYLKRSGEKATTAFAKKDAARFYERAYEICERLGDHRQAAEVAGLRGMVHLTSFEIADAIADFERMLSSARTAQDEHQESLALANRAFAEFFAHEFEAGVRSANESLAIAKERFDDVSFVANLGLGGIYLVTDHFDDGVQAIDSAIACSPSRRSRFLDAMLGEFEVLMPNWHGDFDEAIAAFERAQVRLQPQGAITLIPTKWGGMVALGGRGDYERALRLGLETIELSERTESFPDMRARALNTMGWLYAEIEDHERALDWSARGLDMAQQIESADPEFENNALLNVGDALVALGDHVGAEKRYLEVESIVRNPKPPDLWMMWRYSQHLTHSLGELALAAGEAERALGYADECLTGAVHSRAPKNEVKGRRLRAQALAALDEPEAAAAELQAALIVARRIKNPPQLWKTLVAIGDLSGSDDARGAYAEAASVIEAVAAGLEPGSRETLLRSARITRVREAAK